MQITLQTPGLMEHESMHFTAEASDIGLRPGQWPDLIPTTLGNSRPLIAQSREVRDGDLLWVDYYQSCGCIRLRVYND